MGIATKFKKLYLFVFNVINLTGLEINDYIKI